MNKLLVASLLVTTAVGFAPAAFAQDVPHTVKFNLTAVQPTLFDDGDEIRDTFTGSVDDASGITSFEVVCSPGAKGTFGFGRKDETCAVSGTGWIRNPANLQQTLKRVVYNGGFVVEGKKDGYTNMATINAVYEGPAAPDDTTFGGSVSMKPENPSASALEIAAKALDYVKDKAAGDAVEFDTAVDAIRYNDFVVPHVGQKDTVSCTWSGDDVYTYVNAQWQQEFDIKCGDATFALEGNMALIDAPAGSEHDHEYLINLLIAGEDGSGGDPFAVADPFAVVPGITGVLKMTDSGRVTDDGVAEKIVVVGELTGVGVPLELTHELGETIIVFARAKFGE